MSANNGNDPEASFNKDQVKTLIGLLSHKDGMKREGARETLVAMGDAAVRPLMHILEDEHNPCRWEAAKALAEIGSPDSIEMLIHNLKDPDSDIQWLAAEGLINIGRAALKPLLRALVDDPESHRLRDGVHHVLHDLEDDDLREQMHPLLDDMRQGSPSESVQGAAEQGLKLVSSV